MAILYSLWDAPKIVFWGIFIAVNTYSRKEREWRIMKQTEKVKGGRRKIRTNSILKEEVIKNQITSATEAKNMM